MDGGISISAISSVFTATLKISQVAYELKAVGEQTRELLDQTKRTDIVLSQVHDLRYKKSELLSAEEKAWIDITIENGQSALRSVALLIEPARVDMERGKSVSLAHRTMFVLRDSHKVPLHIAKLNKADAALNACMSMLCLRPSPVDPSSDIQSEKPEKGEGSQPLPPPSHELSEMINRRTNKRALFTSGRVESRVVEQPIMDTLDATSSTTSSTTSKAQVIYNPFDELPEVVEHVGGNAQGNIQRETEDPLYHYRRARAASNNKREALRTQLGWNSTIREEEDYHHPLGSPACVPIISHGRDMPLSVPKEQQVSNVLDPEPWRLDVLTRLNGPQMTTISKTTSYPVGPSGPINTKPYSDHQDLRYHSSATDLTSDRPGKVVAHHDPMRNSWLSENADNAGVSSRGLRAVTSAHLQRSISDDYRHTRSMSSLSVPPTFEPSVDLYNPRSTATDARSIQSVRHSTADRPLSSTSSLMSLTPGFGSPTSSVHSLPEPTLASLPYQSDSKTFPDPYASNRLNHDVSGRPSTESFSFTSKHQSTPSQSDLSIRQRSPSGYVFSGSENQISSRDIRLSGTESPARPQTASRYKSRGRAALERRSDLDL